LGGRFLDLESDRGHFETPDSTGRLRPKHPNLEVSVGYGIKDILHGKAKHLLHLETEPGLGCTEPAAIGLAAAAAASVLSGEAIDSITVAVDANIYKNAMGVIIPNAGGEGGAPLAAALGAAGGDANLGLQVFASVDAAGLARAKALLAAGKVTAGIKQETGGLYVEVAIASGGQTAVALTTGTHDNLVSLTLDGQARPLPGKASGGQDGAPANELDDLKRWLVSLSLAEMVDILDDLDSDDLGYIRAGLALNAALVEYGLAKGPGIGVGRGQLALVRQGLLKKDMVLWACIRAAAGIDSRMGGVALPAMTLAGSGNQGIAAGMPVAAAAQFAVIEDEAVLLRAVTLSYLVTCFIKASAGLLSALCGSGIAGGAGVAAGVAYLFGANLAQIGGAIKNHLENAVAVVCDGAKTSCALKVGELVGSGVKSALLSMHGVIVRPTDGIVCDSAEATMRGMETISKQGLAGMDPAILGIMLAKRG
jgi:L-cysteine desulfidase